jgi:hypothetical protein
MMSASPRPGFLAHLEPVLDHYGYLAVGGFVLLEDFGIPVPGETILIAAAVYAGAGRLSVVGVGLIVFLAPKAPGQVPAGVNTPTAGSGEAIRHSTRMPSAASPKFTSCTISLGSLWRCRPAACRSADLRPYRSSVRG